MSEPKSVLVTGAAGYIGARIVERLLRTGDLTPLAGIHSNNGVARLARLGAVKVMVCDLEKETDLRAAFAKADAIVHCAKGAPPTMAEQLATLLRVMKELPGKHLVYLSSVDVYSQQTGSVTEDSPIEPTGDAYGDAKRACEALCRQGIADGLKITILRPSIVFGPFSKYWLHRYLERFQLGTLQPLEETHNGTCNFIYVDDLANAIIAVLRTPEKSAGEAFNVSSGTLPWNEFFRLMAVAFGGGFQIKDANAAKSSRVALLSPLRNIAKFALAHQKDRIMKMRSNSPFMKKIMGAVENRLRASPDSNELALYGKKWRILSEKICRTLEIDLPTAPEQGVDLATDYLRSYGYLDRTS